jgi:hypothetical protein
MGDAATRLAALLEEERRLLRSGSFDDLPRLVRRKNRLAAAFARGDQPAADVARIQDLAGRNAGLLAAALEGVRAAAERLRAPRAAALPLDTYGADGTRTRLSGAAPLHERRA